MDEHGDVTIRMRIRDAVKAKRDVDKVSRSVDNLGDQAAQASRKLGRLHAATGATRVNLGPFSTSLRFATLGVGYFTIAAGKAAPAALGLAEAAGSVVGGLGGAGGVGLLAIGQAAGVASLGLGDLMDAMGGNEAAAKKLTPRMRVLLRTYQEHRQELQKTADAGMAPGLEAGGQKALRNFGALNGIVRRTSRTIGGLASDAGGMLGSKAWGRDLKTVGGANVRIINNLGHAGLRLADAFRHVVTEAAPLAVWLSKQAEHGASLLDQWVGDKRRTGELRQFFQDARRDITLLGSAGGHGTRGLLNLFGSHDVDGTRTLASLDRVMSRFERWSRSPAVRHGFGDAFMAGIPRAVSATMDAVARNLPHAAGRAATVFWNAFWGASTEGKALAGAVLFTKLGGFSKLGGLLWDQVGGGGKGSLGKGKGVIPVFVTNPGFGGNVPGTNPGKGGKAGWLGALASFATRRALPVVGTGIALGELGLLGAKGLGAIFGDDRSPVQRRDSASQQASRLLGKRKVPVLDKDGYPIAGKFRNSAPETPAQRAGGALGALLSGGLSTKVQLVVDGRVLAEQVAKHTQQEQRRR